MLLYRPITAYLSPMGSDINPVGQISRSMSMTGLDLPGLVQLIQKMFGQEILYVIVTLAGLAYLAYHRIRYGRLLAGSQMMFVYVVVLLFGVLYFCYLYNVLPQISILGARPADAVHDTAHPRHGDRVLRQSPRPPDLCWRLRCSESS